MSHLLGAQCKLWPAPEDKPLPKALLGPWKEGAVPCPFCQVNFQYTVASCRPDCPHLPTSPSQDKDPGLGMKSCYEEYTQERHLPRVPVVGGMEECPPWGQGRQGPQLWESLLE